MPTSSVARNDWSSKADAARTSMAGRPHARLRFSASRASIDAVCNEESDR